MMCWFLLQNMVEVCALYKNTVPKCQECDAFGMTFTKAYTFIDGIK